MVRPPIYDSNGMKKGAWSEDEDNKLRAFVLTYGHSNWRLLPNYAGLKRCGKSCRLRWMNHLKPGVKRGHFTKQEEDLIIKFHAQLGNKWSTIAGELPGRTDNDIKNFWNTRVARLQKPNSPPAQPSSSIDDDHHHLLEMPPIDASLEKINDQDESTDPPSSDTNHSLLPATQYSEMDCLWGTDDATNSTQNYAPLLEEETSTFLYDHDPQLYYYEKELWMRSSMNAAADDEDHSNGVGGSIWEESFAFNNSDYQPQTRECAPLVEQYYGVYDPFCLWNL